MSETLERLKPIGKFGLRLAGGAGLVCLCANLSGCGSSTGLPLPRPFVITGRVLAPAGTVIDLETRAKSGRAIDLSSNVPVGAGVVVQLGSVDGNGDIPPASIMATTTTSTTGTYTFTFPNPIQIQPSMVVIVSQTVGATRTPLLYSVLTGPITDVSPATTAATQAIYSAARAAKILIPQFKLLDLQTYFNDAMLATAADPVQTTVPAAISAAADSIAASTAAANSQATAIADASAPAGSGAPGQAQSMTDLYANAGAGTGLNLLVNLLTIPLGQNIPYPFSQDGLSFSGSLSHSTNGTGSGATVNITGQYLVRGQYAPGSVSADTGVLVNVLVTMNVSGSVGTGSIVGAIEYPGRPVETVNETLTYSVSGASQIVHTVQTVSQDGSVVAVRNDTATTDTLTGIKVETFDVTVHDPAAPSSYVTAHGSFQTTPASSDGTTPASTTGSVSLTNASAVSVALAADSTGTFTGSAVLGGQPFATVSIANGVVTVTPLP